jgi:mannose-6-phosphate isomerase-like protein (cupin superfamily)
MFVKHLRECREFTAGDGSMLREFLHPEKTDLKIGYSLAHAKVGRGQTTKPHKLKSCEVYYIIEGQGLMHIDEESFEVKPNCAVYIPPNARQYIENTGECDLKFLCIVEPAWRQEDEKIFEG